MASRQEKYPNTDTFNYVNVNPHNRKSGDCVVRAVAYFCGVSWEQAVRDLTEVGLKHGYLANDMKTVEKYLLSKGYIKQPQPRKSDGTKYTVAEFVKKFNTGVYLINMANHESIVDHGVNIDIWDCVKYGGCVGNFWRHN